jgi:iron complex outermembrane receptor protein
MLSRIFTAAVICAAITLPAGAEEPAGGVDFFQSTLGDILDTPLLAASYAEERPSDAAATAYVVTAETIDKRGYASLADLLNDTPQFQVQRNSDVRRLNLISVRGIPNNERLVILYDGVRVTPPTGDLLALAGQFSLRDAEKVEVVLGPMSSVYGADAFSGVINVVTRSGKERKASASYGSFSGRSASLSAGADLSKEKENAGAPSAYLAYSAQAADGPKLPDFYRKDYSWYNSQYQAGLVQKKYYDPATVGVPVRRYDAKENSSFLNTRLKLGSFETGLIKMKESHSSSIGVKPELSLYVKDARFATDYWTAFLKHSYASPDDTWKLTTLGGFYSYEIAPETKFINSFSDYNDAYKYASAKTTYIEETLAFEPAQDFPALIGFSYQENSVLPYTTDLGHKFNADKSPLSQGFTYTGSTIPVDFYSLNYSNTGAFMRLQAKEIGRATFSLGLRYDNNTAYGETWNPRAGVVWKPGDEDHTIVKLLYGEAYLAPSPFYSHKHFGSFYSIGISPTDPSGYHSAFFHVPNENLEPEKVRSVEGVLTQDFGHALRISLNPYYNKVNHLIQDVLIGPGIFHGVKVDQMERAENQGTMETYGGTLRADGVVKSGHWNFETWTAYTYSEGRLSGKTIPFNSLHTVQAGFSALHGPWTLTPKALYRSASHNQDGGRVAQFTVADLFIRYACHRIPGLTAHLELKNIFDRRYYNAAYGGGADRLDGAPQTPFEAAAGLTYKF